MAKRFTDNEIWKKQRWFKKLSPTDKLVFFYIKDQCTHWGIWNIDCIELMEDTGLENFDLNSFIESVNTEYDKITGSKINKKRLILLPNNLLWITGFLQFQWENKAGLLNLNAGAVKHGLQSLYSMKLLEMCVNEGFIIIDEGSMTLDDGSVTLDEGSMTLDPKTLKTKKIIGWLSNACQALGRGKGKVDINNNLNYKRNGKPVNFDAQGAEILAERRSRRNSSTTNAN